MNRNRRKALNKLVSQLEKLKASLEELWEAEEECRDNIPASLWDSERYEKANDACDNLSEAVSYLEDVISYIESATE